MGEQSILQARIHVLASSLLFVVCLVLSHLLSPGGVSPDNLRRWEEARYPIGENLSFEVFETAQIVLIGLLLAMTISVLGGSYLAKVVMLVVVVLFSKFNFLHLYDQFVATLLLILCFRQQMSYTNKIILTSLALFFHWQTFLILFPIYLWNRIASKFHPRYIFVLLSFTTIPAIGVVLFDMFDAFLVSTQTFTISQYGNPLFTSYSLYLFWQTTVVGFMLCAVAIALRKHRYVYEIYGLFLLLTAACLMLSVSEDFYFRLCSPFLFLVLPILLSVMVEDFAYRLYREVQGRMARL